MVASTHAHRRKLEEIAGQHHLKPAERALVTANDAAHLIDHVEQPRMQHGNLVDDENVSALQLPFASGTYGFDQIVGERVGKSDTAP